MKYLIKTLTCIFLCANINAQILTMPQIDTTINYTLNVRYISDTISIQSNQGPWDFSSGSLLNSSSKTKELIPIFNTSYSLDYPHATWRYTDNGSHNFIGINNDSWTYNGEISFVTTEYSTPLILLPFPFSAGQTHVDSITTPLIGFNVDRIDKNEAKYLSSGTLTLPNGVEYLNAVLLEVTRTFIDNPGPFQAVTTMHMKNWMVQNYPVPVMRVYYMTQDHPQNGFNTLELTTDYIESSNISMPNSNMNFQSNNKFRELIKTYDLLGKESNNTNKPLFYIYNDGFIEKKIILD